MSVAPYDPTLKALVEIEPRSWPMLLGGPTGPTVVMDADIATVSGAADKVLHVATDPPYLLHLEFVAGHDVAVLPRKLLVRNSLLADRHDLPVRSGVVLLRPGADSPQLTGIYQRALPGEQAYLSFRYQVVRVWQLAAEPLLTGPLALLPLAPISAVTEAELPGIIQRIEHRLGGPRRSTRAKTILAATYILMGLRYSPNLVAQLFRGVVSMKESSTYQAILEEGRALGEIAEAKKILRLQGEEAFGPPDARTAAAIERLKDLARLEELLRKVRTATSWQQLLGRPANRRNGHRHPSP